MGEMFNTSLSRVSVTMVSNNLQQPEQGILALLYDVWDIYQIVKVPRI